MAVSTVVWYLVGLWSSPGFVKEHCKPGVRSNTTQPNSVQHGTYCLQVEHEVARQAAPHSPYGCSISSYSRSAITGRQMTPPACTVASSTWVRRIHWVTRQPHQVVLPIRHAVSGNKAWSNNAVGRAPPSGPPTLFWQERARRIFLVAMSLLCVFLTGLQHTPSRFRAPLKVYSTNMLHHTHCC